ncbi:uncharacterized protein H6S33_003392 [Morchella sextelata]|uniref:uncharacterized protein n=1 Tax=Morchella sextelata TaxID=1174677 RepID=UPI001D0504DD|nr:uncharacterized protein H6S33_003392 [Morchella sextelata]KAH0606558.1 hypothetical protein H6S33_003392 [Morchella sextelata]
MPSDKEQTNSSAPVQTAQGQTYNNVGGPKKDTSTRRNEAPHRYDIRQEYTDIHFKAGARGEGLQRTFYDERTDSNSRYSNKRLEDEIRQRVEAELERKYSEKYEEMLGNFEQDRKSLENNNKIQLRKLEEAYRKSQATLEESHWAFSRKEQETQDLISKLRSNINELTVSVSRTVNVSGVTTRDDDYFEAEFASLKNSIHQWARQSFRQTDAVTYDQLPPSLSKLLGVDTPGFIIPHDSKIGSAEFEAIMAHTMIFDMIFKSKFLLPWERLEGLEELHDLEQSEGHQRPDIASTFLHYIGGTGEFAKTLKLVPKYKKLTWGAIMTTLDLKKREWFTQTISMLFAHHEYEEFLNSNIQSAQMILQELSNSLLPLEGAKLDKSAKRLASIISKATQLHKETFQQVSPFFLHTIKPGEQYNPSFMEELNLPDTEETSGQHYVQAVLFPPVFRIGFNAAGNNNLDYPVLIRKGVVKCFLEKS